MTQDETLETGPAEGDLRVWFIPQVPGEPFTLPVAGPAEALAALNAISLYTLWLEDEAGLLPDASNAGGAERWETDGEGGFDWYDVDEDELTELSGGGE